MGRLRVGVITLPGSFNYGNRLQNRAVVELFGEMGCDAVDLLPAVRGGALRFVGEFAKRCAKRVLGIPAPPPSESLMTPGRRAAFARFCELVPSRAVGWADGGLAGSFDLFSVGSDQVWNPRYIVGYEDWYYLKFARPGQRVALAPSIGLDRLDARQAARLRRGVEGFPMLSVREGRGAELIRAATGREAAVLCDPTLAVGAAHWRSLADDRVTPSGPYVLAYLLGGRGEHAEALDLATRGGRLPVVPLSDRQAPGEPDAGPAEFLSLVENAAHVVTDSFHAAVFSAIFETPLTVVRRAGGPGMFSRLETLADKLGLWGKVWGHPSFSPGAAGDYGGTADAIAREREAFLAYMREALSGGARG